jgi:hypothetical protein
VQLNAGKRIKSYLNIMKKAKKNSLERAKGGKGNYAKGGEVKKYMGGGSVHKKKKMILQPKVGEHQEKHNELPVGRKRTHL